MANMLERNKKVKTPQKTYQEHAEDALYREVWEDVNNEKTKQFLKKYGKYLVAGALIIMIIITSVQIGIRAHRASKMATAENYETALENTDANALAGLARNTSGATADLAMFQAYILDKDVSKLEELATNGKTQEFRDLARMHVVSVRGDEMDADAVEKYLAPLNTKKSPFYYTASITIAQKYLSVGNRDAANKWLDKILGDENAPTIIKSNAESLR